ncbi:MAG: hypothetical protein JNN04_02885 [Cyclobacteriaceae bacterium]|nr:hypothetical protein [Cyclobacteriaceae bacterium]
MKHAEVAGLLLFVSTIALLGYTFTTSNPTHRPLLESLSLICGLSAHLALSYSREKE